MSDPQTPSPEIPELSELDASATLIVPRESILPSPEMEGVWHIHLEVIGGPMDGLTGRSPKIRFTLGRSRENDLVLMGDKMVSSRHACIVREGKTFYLEDLGSRNGTFIGEEPLHTRVPIGPGSTFVVGQTQLEFMPR